MKVTTDSCFFGAWAAEEIKKGEPKIRNVLDIGTGTGLLSLIIAQKNDVDIDAVEIEREAALQAKENVEASPWKNRIHVFNEDILCFSAHKKYDCIISNPPFYENELTSEVQEKNTAHHIRQLKISQVLQIIKTNLKEEGSFFLMYPFKLKEEMQLLFQQNELHAVSSVILSQSVSHSPFRIIVKGRGQKNAIAHSTSVSVWNEHQQYTTPFTDLLKDYYLYL
jgi:tRNA1Val (adenine37-N6)-methyltransferase